MRAKPLRPSFYCLVKSVLESDKPLYFIYKVVPTSDNEFNDDVYFRYNDKDSWNIAQKSNSQLFPEFIKSRGHTVIAESNMLSDLESLRASLMELIG